MTTFAAPRITESAWPRLLTGVALAAAAFVATLAMIRHGGMVPAQPWSGQLDPVSAGLAACSALPLILCWRSPLAVFVATTAAFIALAGLGYPADVMIGPAVALYFLAASGTRKPIVVISMFGGYLVAAAMAKQALPASEALHSGLVWGVAWFAGERHRLRREQIASLHARAERAEQDARRDRQLAVAEERARIARDLHDSAGHAINVIAVRAGAARLRHEPERSLAALADIETLARQTAGQIDHIVGTLRDRDNDLAEPPGIASLQTLIARHRDASLVVDAQVTGPPPEPGSPVDYAVYRIVQEGLTNAARYGTGSATVTITFGETSADIHLTNPFTGGQAGRGTGGHGLVGMRERVSLLGGTLTTGARDGTFRVHATVPLGPQQ